MQIGLTAFVVALAASKSEEKSHGIDDATVRASPSRQDVAGSPHRTVRNLNSFCTRSVVPLGMQRQWLYESQRRVSICLFPTWSPAKRESPRRSDYANPACLGSESSITASIVLDQAYGSMIAHQSLNFQRHGKGSWTVSWIKSAITPALKEKRLVHLTVGRPGGCLASTSVVRVMMDMECPLLKG